MSIRQMKSRPKRVRTDWLLGRVHVIVLTWVVCVADSAALGVVKMRIAVIGQSVFGQEVYKELRKDGHNIVGVFTIPDKDGKADPLGENALHDAVGLVKADQTQVK